VKRRIPYDIDLYYKDKCSFDEISAYGEELYGKMQKLHKQDLEYAFVKDELPEYAKEYGGFTAQALSIIQNIHGMFRTSV